MSGSAIFPTWATTYGTSIGHLRVQMATPRAFSVTKTEDAWRAELSEIEYDVIRDKVGQRTLGLALVQGMPLAQAGCFRLAWGIQSVRHYKVHDAARLVRVRMVVFVCVCLFGFFIFCLPSCL